MTAKKYLLLIIILPILMLSLATINVPVHSAFADPYVKIYVSPTLYPFVAPDTTFMIDVYIETSGIPDYSPTGIVGWRVYFQVNPASLDILAPKGATSDYFLWEFADWYKEPYPWLHADIDSATGFAYISEEIPLSPLVGAGDTWSGYKLVSINVRSNSDTIPCLLDIFNAEYMTPDENWHQVDIIEDGYYGAAPSRMSAVDGGSTQIDLTSPIGTTWHELYPNYCGVWELIAWTDNTDSNLSASDQIEMLNETGWVYPFHVDAVTTTIHWTFKPDENSPPTGPPAHAEPDESYPPLVEGFMSDPVGSFWHQIYPDYSKQFNITSWEDNTPGDPGTPNGVFDPFDQFDFVYEDEPGVTYWAHLDAVSTDIIISQIGPCWERLEHDVAVTDVTPFKTIVGEGYSSSINVTVENQGIFTETFIVTAYYSNETLTPGQWETFWSMGDVNRDGYIDDLDGDLISAAYGSTPGDPDWNPDADLNEDGWVFVEDMQIYGLNYGKDIWTEFNILGGGIGRQPVIDLSSGDSTTLVFIWNTTGVPYGDYIISARATRVTGEADITDNAYDDGWVRVTIPGDIDGDYYVGSADAGVLATAYGSWRGDPLYVPEADFDCDGYIGSADAGILSGNYGNTAS